MKINLGQLAVTSPAFAHGDTIPSDHTVDGDGTFPGLDWGPAPDGTVGWTVISDDPDAPLVGGFTHLVAHGLPAGVTSLRHDDLATIELGVNGLGAAAWQPPAPPPGHDTHSYYFHVFALAAVPELPAGAGRAEVLEAIEPHVIEQARLVGRYERSTS